MGDKMKFANSGELKRAVREAIAEQEGSDVSLVRSPATIDLNVLDDLFVSATDSRSARGLSASFRYEDFEVEVRIDRRDGVTIV